MERSSFVSSRDFGDRFAGGAREKWGDTGMPTTTSLPATTTRWCGVVRASNGPGNCGRSAHLSCMAKLYPLIGPEKENDCGSMNNK